jgi:hypothetical protein
MAVNDVAVAIQRMSAALVRHPQLGRSAVTPAVARLERDLRVLTSPPKGALFPSDMQRRQES